MDPIQVKNATPYAVEVADERCMVDGIRFDLIACGKVVRGCEAIPPEGDCPECWLDRKVIDAVDAADRDPDNEHCGMLWEEACDVIQQALADAGVELDCYSPQQVPVRPGRASAPGR